MTAMICRNRPRLVCAMLALLLALSVQGAQADAPRWLVQVLSWEIAGDLQTTQAIMQYGGALDTVEYSQAPREGYVFLLLALHIEKEGVGPSEFGWDDVAIEDAQGNRYPRHPNDIFLRAHNLPRIPSTTLTFGQYEGFICFEIPCGLSEDGLRFLYIAQGQAQSIPLEKTSSEDQHNAR